MLRWMIGGILLICTSCMAKKMQYVEVISPHRSAYYGHQVVLRDSNGVQIDSSFYQDLKLQPFVESGHFFRNRTVQPDLVADTSKLESIKWFSSLSYGTLKRLSKASHGCSDACTPYEFFFRMNGERSSLVVYLPEDTTQYHPDWEAEMEHTRKLFQPKAQKIHCIQYYQP